MGAPEYSDSGRLVLVQNLFRWQRRDSLPFVGPRKSWPSDTWWCVLLSAVPDIKRNLQLLVETLTFWWRRWLTLLCSLRRWAPSRSWLLCGMLETLQAGSFSTGLCCMFSVLTEGWISIISVLMASVMLSAEGQTVFSTDVCRPEYVTRLWRGRLHKMLSISRFPHLLYD